MERKPPRGLRRARFVSHWSGVGEGVERVEGVEGGEEKSAR